MNFSAFSCIIFLQVEYCFIALVGFGKVHIFWKNYRNHVQYIEFSIYCIEHPNQIFFDCHYLTLNRFFWLSCLNSDIDTRSGSAFLKSLNTFLFFQEISQLRYMLCPRHLKESQFWRIYFKLVKSHVAE